MHMNKIIDHSKGYFSQVTRDELTEVALPQKTESYQPVPYSSLINIIEEKLDKENLKIVNENYRLNKSGEKMFGILGVVSNDTPNDLRMSLGFSNSYDKSLAVGMVSGAQVHICTNGMFHGEFKKIRKHTVNFYNDVYDIVNFVVDGMQDKFYNLVKDVEKMKEFELNAINESFLFGEVLLHGQKIAKPKILAAAVEHWKKPPYEEFEPRNMWSWYNSFTDAYKQLRPEIGVKPYIELHKYCLHQLN